MQYKMVVADETITLEPRANLLEYPVCLGSFVFLRTLSCQHELCGDCVRVLGAETLYFPCPLCRTKGLVEKLFCYRKPYNKISRIQSNRKTENVSNGWTSLAVSMTVSVTFCYYF